VGEGKGGVVIVSFPHRMHVTGGRGIILARLFAATWQLPDKTSGVRGANALNRIWPIVRRSQNVTAFSFYFLKLGYYPYWPYREKKLIWDTSTSRDDGY